MLRRMHRWKGLHPGRHADVLQDLHQDLLLDCLEHGDTIAALSTQERNGRWFRLLEKRHYQLRLRDGRQTEPGISPDSLVGGPREGLPPQLGTSERNLAHRLLDAATHLKNGRLNTGATAQRLGVHRRHVVAAWARMATALGYDRDYVDFWRRRLVEALVGLAADLLRDRLRLHIHGEEQRTRPDPRGRLRRIRHIRNQLSVRPVPADIRGVLSLFSGGGIGQRIAPEIALDAAERLDPANAGVQLWRFEAAVATGDLRHAARALWKARATEVEPVRLVLARARLLEARGRPERAEAVLRRALQRQRGDSRLRTSLRALAPATPALAGARS